MEGSIGERMLNVCTEGILVCWAFCNVRLNGLQCSLGLSKLVGLTIFRYANQVRLDTLSGTVAH